MLSSQLLDAIFRTADMLPQSSVDNVAAALEAEDFLSTTLRGRVLNSVALPQERILLVALMDVWAHEARPPDSILISSALRSAAHTRAALAKQEHIELVWTGPSPGRTLRRIDQALLQVIDSAQYELLLVTFAAYRAPLLMTALRHAIERGVLVRFVAESTKASAGKVSFDPRKAFVDLADRMHYYEWPREKRSTDAHGNFGVLHAKCAMADDALLLVSSANLTEHAMLLNMEMGLLIYGGSMPIELRAHFARLISEGILEKH